MIQIENIPRGHENAVQRPANPLEDRKLRREIEQANQNGDCIINVGKGYYRPVPGNATDEAEMRQYLAKELSRARKIHSKRLAMRQTFERWREVGILTDSACEA